METLKSSVMTGKLEGIPGVSTSPLDNDFCNSMAKKSTVCEECYSRRMLKGMRKNCRPRWKANGEWLSRIQTNEDLASFGKKLKPKHGIVRFHPHGELINLTHLINLYKIAESRPEITFALWTKRKDLTAGTSKPKNLVLIYSNPVHPSKDYVMPIPPRGFDKVFNVVSKEYNGQKVVNCGSKKCIECKLCYSLETTDCIVEIVK